MSCESEEEKMYALLCVLSSFVLVSVAVALGGIAEVIHTMGGDNAIVFASSGAIVSWVSLYIFWLGAKRKWGGSDGA